MNLFKTMHNNQPIYKAYQREFEGKKLVWFPLLFNTSLWLVGWAVLVIYGLFNTFLLPIVIGIFLIRKGTSGGEMSNDKLLFSALEDIEKRLKVLENKSVEQEETL